MVLQLDFVCYLLRIEISPFMRELSPSQGTRPLSPKTEENTDMILIAILFFISILVLGTGTRKGMKRKWASEENICFMNFFRDELREKKMPSGSKIMGSLKILTGRTVAQIRARVHNIIMEKQKWKKICWTVEYVYAPGRVAYSSWTVRQSVSLSIWPKSYMAITFSILNIATWYLAFMCISWSCTFWVVNGQGQGHPSSSNVI